MSAFFIYLQNHTNDANAGKYNLHKYGMKNTTILFSVAVYFLIYEFLRVVLRDFGRQQSTGVPFRHSRSYCNRGKCVPLIVCDQRGLFCLWTIDTVVVYGYATYDCRLAVIVLLAFIN